MPQPSRKMSKNLKYGKFELGCEFQSIFKFERKVLHFRFLNELT